MFAGHRRVDSGGRGGLQWKEDTGKNVSPLSLNIKLCNNYLNGSSVFPFFTGRLVIIVSLGFGIVKPRLGPLLNR